MPGPNLIDDGGATGTTATDAALPQPVVPVDGADAVDFPWGAAAAAVAALEAAKSRLDSQLQLRAEMRPALTEWEGAFRDDYDAGSSRLTAVAAELSRILATRISSIVSGAEDANAQQHNNNLMAESATGATPI
jgi:hypothetical protein